MSGALDTMYCLVDDPTDPSAATWAKSMEVYGSVLKTWETHAQSMTKARCNFSLVVAEGELYAVGDAYSSNMSIEKLDKELGVWRIVTKLRDWRRPIIIRSSACSKIFVFGGREEEELAMTWDSFDVITITRREWISASLHKKKRKIPLGFYSGQALTVYEPESISDPY